MILVDTSVWVDHLRRGDAQLADLLERGLVAGHPFIVGEIACGSLTRRPLVIELLQDLPSVFVADHEEVLGFIERHRLYGKGIGYVDVHLLASVALTSGSRLWSRDRRLRTVADVLGLSAQEFGAH